MSPNVSSLPTPTDCSSSSSASDTLDTLDTLDAPKRADAEEADKVMGAMATTGIF